MKKAFDLVLFLLLGFVLLSSCNHKAQVPAFDSSYREYINAFTSGVISRKSSIKIHFAQKVNVQSVEDVLDFKPAIEGKLVWIDEQSLEFIPDEELKRGEVYVGELDLQRLMEVPDSLRIFEFGFQVIKTAYEWGSLQLKATPETQMNYYALEGSVLSSDMETPEDLQDLFRAFVKSKEVKVKWSNSELARKYDFRVDSIPREEKAHQVELKVNTAAAGVANLKDQSVKMSALGEFKYLGYDMYPGTERVVMLKFTDPIKPDQDLSGLITLEKSDNLRFEIENTTIKVYPPEEVFGTRMLRIAPGIRNILDYKFAENVDEKLAFHNQKPQVEFMGDGNIIPTGDKVLVPIKTIALKAVDVKVIRIAQRNVLQFLQENNLNGNQELYRVGEVVAEKKIEFQQSGKATSNWSNYSIDLAPLIKPEPGAIYKLMISFKKEYSAYACDENLRPDNEDDEEGYYDYYYQDYYPNGNRAYNHNDYYFPYPNGYRWKERDNPCHVSYYISERFASKSVLASDLGLIAKKGDEDEIDITVSDLKTTEPINGVKVEAYSYQQKPLGSVETDANGWAKLKVKQPVFFLVATKASQKGYLKLLDGEAISLSNFQVSGEEVKKSLKGFLYGERGVWRPGDSLFLNFMLEDGAGTLPEDHPVHFELFNPNGVIIDRQLSTKPIGRIHSFTTYTVPEAPTGNYKARIRVGDVSFEERIRIETVKPNRLEIDLDFQNKVQDISEGFLSGDLHVEWLTGVEASNVKAKIDLKIANEYKPFPKEKGFRFQDPVRHFNTGEKTWFEGGLNASGNVQINEEIGSYNSAPGMLKARALVKAFEGGGNFSTEYFDTKLSPFKRYVGLKMPEPSRGYFLTTDQEYTIPVRTFDPEGKPLSVEGLEIKIYKVDWHWWYHSGNDHLKRYVDNEAVHLYKRGKVSTLNGRGEYKLKVEYPNWGRFLIRICDGSGHCTGELTYFDWPEGTGGDRPELSGATMLSFKPEKEVYKVGEEVVTKIPVSEGSRVLITLENGSGILKKEWVKANSGKLSYSFTADESMAPNVYLSASLIQPHQQTINDRPIRLFGVVPVKIVNESTRLNPEISTSAVWRPETTVKVKVKESKGKAMNYTLAIVDEGLLNLTQFKRPDPWQHFNAAEALGIRTWDIYENVLGAFSSNMGQILAIGGDAALSKKGLNNQNRFKPMVRVLGPFKLNARQTAEHAVSIPNYIGKARIMVVAEGGTNSYGSAEKTVPVRKPLMVLSTLPRVLSPNEDITLPVTVFAMEEQVKSVQIKVSVDGELSIVGEDDRSVNFSKTGEKVIDFKLKTHGKIGKARVKVTAVSGSEKAYDQTELNIRIPNAPVTETEDFFLDGGKDTTLTCQPVGVEGTNSVTVEAYGMPPINLQEHLKFLFGYPHGCAEQTISRVFPLLFLDNIMNLSDNMKATRKQHFNTALNKLYTLQAANGGFKYWPGSSRIDEYVTSYAGHFLSIAREKGYPVQTSTLLRWKSYQKSKARSWSPRYYSNNDCSNCDEQAYRLYTLAQIGEPEIGAMNRLRETARVPAYAFWHLAGAYARSGQKEAAQEVIAKIEEAMKYRYNYHYYSRDITMLAIELEVHHELGQQQKALETGKKLSDRLAGNNRYSTHSLAYSLKSVIKVFGNYNKGKTLGWSFSSGAVNKTFDSQGLVQQYDYPGNNDRSFTYTLKNTGSSPLNFSIVKHGIPLETNLPPEEKNLSMKVSYFYPDGKPLDVSRIRQGQDFMAEVVISRPKNIERGQYGNMALMQLFPSGWEILNTRFLEDNETSEVPGSGTIADYQDIRDDRVYIYFDMSYGHQESFRCKIRLNATYAGRYYLPPVRAYDMYDDDIKARNEGRWVEVIR